MSPESPLYLDGSLCLDDRVYGPDGLSKGVSELFIPHGVVFKEFFFQGLFKVTDGGFVANLGCRGENIFACWLGREVK